METNNIVDFASRGRITDALTDLLRTGAQQLIATAVEAELENFMAQFAHPRTEAGHAAVVRNGHHPARPFQTGIGPVSVRIPKVRSKNGQPVTFRSALVPLVCAQTRLAGGSPDIVARELLRAASAEIWKYQGSEIAEMMKGLEYFNTYIKRQN